MADRVTVRPCAGSRRVGGTGAARACPLWAVQVSVKHSLGRVPTRHPPALVAGTANRVTVRLCPAHPARAFFAKKPHPQGQRAA